MALRLMPLFEAAQVGEIVELSTHEWETLLARMGSPDNPSVPSWAAPAILYFLNWCMKAQR
jgi:hypothetical protein